MALSSILTPGAKVGGKFEVVEVIGFGGMGVVYKVREQVGAVSRIRALKTVLPQFAADENVVKRFREEAEKMCMLEHENIVPVLSYSEEGEFPYLVMPFIEGQTLKDYLGRYQTEQGRPLPLPDVMEIGLELVRGLEIAHRFVNPETRRAQPMIHRDIKPGNIMVRVEGQGGERRLKVLIMDFGIAKLLSDEDTGHSQTDVIGTVKYASPEQIRRGKDIDPRADIYSLGMVLYELYTGRHMFTGLSEHSVLMRMMQREIEDFEVPYPEGTPESFRELIERCVAVDRERRFASVADMRALMRRIVEEDSGRIADEVERAKQAALAERSRALERGADEFAAHELGEGDAMLAQGESAASERRYRQAATAFRSAASAFEKATQAAATEASRRQLLARLEALAELRAAALAAGAERLAADELAQAAQASTNAARFLGVSAPDSRADGDATDILPRVDPDAAARHLAEAERLFREAETKAKQAGLAEQAHAACQQLAEGVVANRTNFDRLPQRLREPAGIADLGAAERAAAAAAKSAAKGDFPAAIAEAGRGLSLLAKLDERRQRTVGEAAAKLSAELTARLSALEAGDHHLLVPQTHAEVRRIADRGEGLRVSGQAADAYTELEKGLDAAERLEKEISARLAERERALRDAEGASREMRRRLEAVRERAKPLADAGDAGCKRAERFWSGGDAAAEAKDWPKAVDQYRHALQEYDAARRADRNRKAEAPARSVMEELRRARVLLQLLPVAPGEAAELAAGAKHAEEGEQKLTAGEFADALPILTAATERLSKLVAAINERQERERVEARAAELRRALAERARLEGEASAQRNQAEAARAAVARLGSRATENPAFARAEAKMKEASAALSAEDFARAHAPFADAGRMFGDLLAELERAELVERLSALTTRRDEAAARISALPSLRKLKRRRQAAVRALEAARAALNRQDEAEATRALTEAERAVDTLSSEAAALGERAAEPRVGWGAVSAVGGAVAAAAAAAVWFAANVERKPSSAPSPTTSVATAAIPALGTTAAVKPEVPAPRPAVEPAKEPTVAVAKVPQKEPTVAPPPSHEPAPPEVAPPPPEHPAPPPLALASAKPTSRSLKINTGEEQRFEASLKSGDAGALQWRLEGETVGRGPSWSLGKQLTASPGRRKLELVGVRDDGSATLKSWDIDIVPPPLGFAELEPAARDLERSPGTPVSFRAPVKTSSGEKLSFLWEINGRTARDADGPRYELKTDAPGEYVVKVRATAPWGASIANTWNVMVAPKPAPPPPAVVPPAPRPTSPAEVASIPKPADAQGEVRAWIQSYCSAFERKDTDALIRLGHLSSQAEATRLKQALSAMEDLKLSCTNPSINVRGDQATVSFDRRDQWTDPRGTTMERALPRINKNLRRVDGRWVAVAE